MYFIIQSVKSAFLQDIMGRYFSVLPGNRYYFQNYSIYKPIAFIFTRSYFETH